MKDITVRETVSVYLFISLMLKPISIPFKNSTHNCSSLYPGLIVILAGWILQERRLNSIKKSFFQFNDHSGSTQLIIEHSSSHYPLLHSIPPHSTLLIHGIVRPRPKHAIKPGPSGAVDVHVNNLTLLNPATSNLPFQPHSISFIVYLFHFTLLSS